MASTLRRERPTRLPEAQRIEWCRCAVRASVISSSTLNHGPTKRAVASVQLPSPCLRSSVDPRSRIVSDGVHGCSVRATAISTRSSPAASREPCASASPRSARDSSTRRRIRSRVPSVEDKAFRTRGRKGVPASSGSPCRAHRARTRFSALIGGELGLGDQRKLSPVLAPRRIRAPGKRFFAFVPPAPDARSWARGPCARLTPCAPQGDAA